MQALSIRKIGLPIGQLEVVKELAWRKRVSRSQVIRDIITDYLADPARYDSLPDMEGPMSGTVTVYVPDEQWLAARTLAYDKSKSPLVVVIRKGLRHQVESEGIPIQA